MRTPDSPWDLTAAQRRQLREARAEAQRAKTPDFPGTIPASPEDDPSMLWRVMDQSGGTRDYSVRPDARRAMYDTRGSSAVYGRARSGVWQLDETLLRES